MDGLFPRGSVIRRVDGEAVLLLGGGRALLMQLAHPMVAQGVAEHSEFEADPFSRLRRTLEASYTIVFGSVEDAERTAAGIRAVHERVVGAGYRATDPELLLWVHATLVDTAMRVYRRLIRPLSPADAATYYAQSMAVAELLGVPLDHQPPDLDTFRAYVRHMVATLRVSSTARQVASAVLHPKLPWVAGPLAALAREMTVGLLPPPLRHQYGLRWDGRRQAALLAATAASRAVLPRVSSTIRHAPTRLLVGA